MDRKKLSANELSYLREETAEHRKLKWKTQFSSWWGMLLLKAYVGMEVICSISMVRERQGMRQWHNSLQWWWGKSSGPRVPGSWWRRRMGKSCSEITTRVAENHSTRCIGSKLDPVTTLPSCYHFLQHEMHWYSMNRALLWYSITLNSLYKGKISEV